MRLLKTTSYNRGRISQLFIHFFLKTQWMCEFHYIEFEAEEKSKLSKRIIRIELSGFVLIGTINGSMISCKKGIYQVYNSFLFVNDASLKKISPYLCAQKHCNQHGKNTRIYLKMIKIDALVFFNTRYVFLFRHAWLKETLHDRLSPVSHSTINN